MNAKSGQKVRELVAVFTLPYGLASRLGGAIHSVHDNSVHLHEHLPSQVSSEILQIQWRPLKPPLLHFPLSPQA